MAIFAQIVLHSQENSKNSNKNCFLSYRTCAVILSSNLSCSSKQFY